MTADDTRTSAPEVGSALVTALGFEPTAGDVGDTDVAVAADRRPDAHGSPVSTDGTATRLVTDRAEIELDPAPTVEVDDETMAARSRGKGPKTFVVDDPDDPVPSVHDEVDADLAVLAATTLDTEVEPPDRGSSGVTPMQVSAPPVDPMPAVVAAMPPPPMSEAATSVPTAVPPGPSMADPMPAAPAVARSGYSNGQAMALRSGELSSQLPRLVQDRLFNRSRKVQARKVRRVVRHIDPWSVLTFSVLFHLCVFAALLLGSVLVWNAALAAGTIESIETFIRELGDYETYEINGDVVFRAAMLVTGILTLASSVMVVLLTVIFNLISDLIGGIRVTVVEEDTVRVRRRSNQ